jgi:hypothetical protein
VPAAGIGGAVVRLDAWLLLSDLALLIADFGSRAHRFCVRRAADCEAIA